MKWIATNTEVPDSPRPVLIYGNGKMATASWNERYDWWDSSGFYGAEWEWEFEPTHWAELPPRPA